MARSVLGRAVRDPVLLGLALGTAGFAVVFLAGLGDEPMRVRLLWASQPFLDALLAWVTWRVARAPSTPQPARRFFGAFMVAGCCFTAGDGYQTVLVLRTPAPRTDAGPVQGVLFVAGVGVLLLVMLTYPTAVDSVRQRLRFWLDAGTVLVGTAGLVWVLTAKPGMHLGSTLLSAGLLMMAAFAAVKLLLSGQAPMTRAGAALAIAATVLQGLAIYFDGTGGYRLLLHLAPSIIIIAGPRVQDLEMRADPRWSRRARRRSYSLLPYVMVAAADGALAYALRGRADVKVWGVLVAVLVITALVAVRQLDSLIDNQELIGRLDASLERLRHLALHDALTGLPNRALFSERLTAAAAGPVALLLIDLDDFKMINDTLGHPAGDAVLRAVAERLSRCVRPDDVAARLGGDEFAILLPGASAAVAERVVERVRAALTEPVTVDGELITVRASVGTADAVAADGEVLLRRADSAMYAAKRSRTRPTAYVPRR